MSLLASLVDDGRVAADWADALAPVEDHLAAVLERVAARRSAGEVVLPAEGDVLRAFARPLAEVRVVIVGQDPYPTPGHPVGLSFAVARDVRPLPRSLLNIRTELHDDLGLDLPEHGDLSGWADQGVLLLNRVLTVPAGEAAGHSRLGWQRVSEEAMRALGRRGGPCVAILWGRHAQQCAAFLGEMDVISSAHPSPLSARKGFFGSAPFSRANASLAAQGAAPVDWAADSSE